MNIRFYSDQNRYFKCPPMSLIFTFEGSIMVKISRFILGGHAIIGLISNMGKYFTLPSYSLRVLSLSEEYFPAVVNMDDFFSRFHSHYRLCFYDQCKAKLGYFKGYLTASTQTEIDRLSIRDRVQWVDCPHLRVILHWNLRDMQPIIDKHDLNIQG
mgnify:CR=1 FL=1